MKIVKSSFIGLVLLTASFSGLAQTATMTTSGNWNAAGNWSGSVIGNLITQTITINNNINPTLVASDNFTVGNTTLTQNNTLTINSGGTLTIGASGNSQSLTTNMNANLSISGKLEIWGDLLIQSNINVAVSGQLIVHGNITISGGASASFSNSGTFTVDGNMTSTGSVNFSNSNAVTIGGTLSVGGGSNLSSSGTFKTHQCSSPASPSFCGSGSLPVDLLYFNGVVADEHIRLNWATASELNFDYFLIEKSFDGVKFSELTEIQGNGTKTSKSEYEFTDTRAVSGMTYYKLLSVDFDGSVEPFKVISVDFALGKNSLDIFPNPLNNSTVNLSLNFKPTAIGRVLITDAFGLPVANYFFENMEPVTAINVTLAPGAYLVKFNTGQFSSVKRIVVE